MVDRVKIRMKNGDTHFARGSASKINHDVELARRQGDTMLDLEVLSIPTGKRFYIDVTEISSIVDDNY